MKIYKSNYETSKTLARHCLNCVTIFWVKPSILKCGFGNFCSRKCSAEYRESFGKGEEHRRKISETIIREGIVSGRNNPNWRGGNRILFCSECGGEFSFKRSTKRAFCSRQCAAKSRGRYFSKENHPGWKGGIGAQKHVGKRMHTKYFEWRKTIFETDGYKCAVCGNDKPRIHAHHILEWNKYPGRRYDVNNGVTLCVLHHQMLHPNIILTDTRKYLLKVDYWENYNLNIS